MVRRIVALVAINDFARRRRRAGRQLPRRRDRVVGHAAARCRGARRPSASNRMPNSSAARATCRSGRPLKHPGRTAARVNAELLEPRIEQRFRTGDPHVAGQRQVEPGADRRAVDRRDRRQDAVRDGEEPVVDLMQRRPAAGALPSVGQVGPGAERACRRR